MLHSEDTDWFQWYNGQHKRKYTRWSTKYAIYWNGVLHICPIHQCLFCFNYGLRFEPLWHFAFYHYHLTPACPCSATSTPITILMCAYHEGLRWGGDGFELQSYSRAKWSQSCPIRGRFNTLLRQKDTHHHRIGGPTQRINNSVYI